MMKTCLRAMVAGWIVIFAGSQLSAQTLLLKFGFGDSGTTTTDSVSGVVLGLLNSNNAAADLHGAAGTGPAGSGQSLDLSGPSTYGANGPMASSYGGNGVHLGALTNFTIAFWIKPAVTLYDNDFRRFFIIGTNGVLDGQTANSMEVLNNANRESGTSIETTINTATTDTANFGACPLPQNQWSFLALTYDRTNLNFYAGSEVAAALLQASTISLASQTVNLGNNWNLFLGNRANGQRPFQGYMADVRLYAGAGSASFVENVRASAIPPAAVAIYTNSVSGNWSVNENWTGLAPAIGGASSNTIVLQPALGALAATNDLAGSFTLNQLDALGNTVSLYGNPISFVLNGATLPALTNSSGISLNLYPPITLGDNTTFGTGSSITNHGVISGGGSLTEAGAGTLALLNTNLYTGNTTVRGGKLRLVAGGSIYDGAANYTASVMLTNNGILEFDNWGYGPVASFGNLDFGSSRIVVNGGTLRCVSTNGTSASRSLTVGTAGGTLDSSVAGQLWDIPYASSYSSMPLNGLMTLTGVGNGEIDQILTGSGSLTVNGGGTWTLAGANTYAGATTVSAGSLIVYGSISSPAAMTVAPGATLSGNGTIASPVTVKSGGTLVPGSATSSVGQLIFSGMLVLNGGSTLNFGLGSIDASDSIVIQGSYVAPASPVSVTISNLNYACNSGTYKLMTGAAGISASSFVLTSLPPGFTGTLSATNGTLYVTMAASPWSQTSALGVPETIGSALSYQITLVSNATSYAAAGLPPGLSLNAGTGLISGTPTNIGIYWATITATSVAGTQSSQLVFVQAPTLSGTLASSNTSPLILTNSGTATTVQPWLDNTLLVNPGKGYAEYYGPSKYTASVIGVGYSRWDWSVVEPTEGGYNWSVVDGDIAAWGAYGLKLAFGIISTDCHYSSYQPTPSWVFAPGTNAQTHSVYTNGAVPMTVADVCGSTNGIVIPTSWDDPVYLARLHEFIAAFGARYNGSTNIAYLDERDYGVWGEGNGGFPGATQTSAGSTQTNYYAPYLRAFPNTQLLEDAWYVSVEDWLVSQGTGTRRDGICCGFGNGSPCLAAYPYHPVVMEYWGMATNVYRGGAENELLIWVTGGRPSYLQFNADGLYPTLTNFYNMIGNLIGYHFVLQRATIPNTIYPGVPFPLSFTWLNDGVAPLIQPCSVAVALLDTNNNVVEQQWLPASNPQGWGSGVCTTESFTNVAFSSIHSLQSGKLAVGLFLNQTDANPKYKLGIQGRTTNGWYIVGSVSLSAVPPPAVPTNLLTTAGNSQVAASWNAANGATGYNLKRSTTNGGAYGVIAGNWNGLAFTNGGLTNGTLYYFVVSATNSAGESANSTPVSARPVSPALTNLTATVSIQMLSLSWPADHTGWRLLVQTNHLAGGLSANTNDWGTVSGSPATNNVGVTIERTNPAEFYRLVYP